MTGYIIIGSILLIGLVYYSFYRLTLKQKDIKIIKKYINKQDGIEYMIIDEKGKTFKISKCFWKLKNNPSELWDIAKEGKMCRIEYYGLDVSTLNLYYEIVDITNINN